MKAKLKEKIFAWVTRFHRDAELFFILCFVSFYPPILFITYILSKGNVFLAPAVALAATASLSQILALATDIIASSDKELFSTDSQSLAKKAVIFETGIFFGASTFIAVIGEWSLFLWGFLAYIGGFVVGFVLFMIPMVFIFFNDKKSEDKNEATQPEHTY